MKKIVTITIEVEAVPHSYAEQGNYKQDEVSYDKGEVIKVLTSKVRKKLGKLIPDDMRYHASMAVSEKSW